MGRNRKFVPTIKLVGLPPSLGSNFFLFYPHYPKNSIGDASVDFWGLCVGVLEPKIKMEVTENPEETIKKEISEETPDDDVPISSSQRFMDVLTQWRRTGDTKGTAPSVPVKRRCSETEELATRSLKMQKIHTFLSQESPKEQNSKCESESEGASDNEKTKENKEKGNLDNSFLNLKELAKESEGEKELSGEISYSNLCNILYSL